MAVACENCGQWSSSSPCLACEKKAAEARIAELERERNKWKQQSDDWQARGWELDSKCDELEGKLADASTDYGLLSDNYEQLAIEAQVLRAKLAEAHGALKALRDAMLVEHGCYPLDEVTPAQKIVVAAMRRADAVLETGGTEAAAVLEAAVAIADRLVECTEEDYRAATKLKDAVDALLAKRGRT